MPRNRGTSPSVQRVLVCLCLCGLYVTCSALPLPESRGGSPNSQMQLARLLYKYGAISSPYVYNEGLSQAAPWQRRKRFGIAGLDNVDVITRILDRQRLLSRKPPLSIRLSAGDLRQMLEAGR